MQVSQHFTEPAQGFSESRQYFLTPGFDAVLIITPWVAHYNRERYYEWLDAVTPAGM